MSLLSGINTSLSGLTAAGTGLAATASNLANLNTEGYRARRADFVDLSGGGVGQAQTTADDSTPVPGGSNVDLARESVALIRAKTLYTANAVALRTQDSMLGTLLDIVDEPAEK